jgi:DNA-binding transcriptional regulator YhcF (GntR family)
MSMRQERGAAPRYAQIAAAIRAQIISGRLGGPGARIPSEPEIIDTYGVSKTTASEALKMLSAEGLIVRRSGAGSFIAAHPPELRSVEVCAGARISARPANSDDFLGGEDIPPGVPALVVEVPGHPAKIYPADRTFLIVSGARRTDRRSLVAHAEATPSS